MWEHFEGSGKLGRFYKMFMRSVDIPSERPVKSKTADIVAGQFVYGGRRKLAKSGTEGMRTLLCKTSRFFPDIRTFVPYDFLRWSDGGVRPESCGAVFVIITGRTPMILTKSTIRKRSANNIFSLRLIWSVLETEINLGSSYPREWDYFFRINLPNLMVPSISSLVWSLSCRLLLS